MSETLIQTIFPQSAYPMNSAMGDRGKRGEEFASCLQSMFLGENLWRTASEQRQFYIRFLIYSF